MIELADVFREAGPTYREHFAGRMLPSHLQAMRDIERCRTPALGGKVYACDECDEIRYAYHSCRNRHCPKCQGDRTQSWREALQARLLACPYILATFTLPEPLRQLARSHQRTVYSVLISAAAHTLIKLTADPRWLGARPGLLAVLHTWTRALLYHPHVHILTTAGGLAVDGSTWRHPVHRDFFVPGRVLSVIFRTKIKDGLEHAGLLDQTSRKVWKCKWVVHLQNAGDGSKAADYVSRYLYRVAITNSQLESFDAGQVTFRFRNQQTGCPERRTLTAEAFIARFLQHVLPRGFTKVRQYGLFSTRLRDAAENARSLLQRAEHQLAIASPHHHVRAAHHDEPLPSEPERPVCPACGVGFLRVIARIPRTLVDIVAEARAPP